MQVDEPTGSPQSLHKATPIIFSMLGREIKITPKAHVSVNKPGYRHEMFVESISLTIGIGKDHVAELVMSADAWKALKEGSEINITTKKEFDEKYTYKKRK